MGTWYLGPSGALVAIPPPLLGPDASPDLIGKVSTSLNGARTLYRAAQPRTWQLQWFMLTEDQTNYLQLVSRGLVGSPVRLVVGEIRNRLPVRVAAGGSYSRSAVDFLGVTSLPPVWVPTSTPASVPVSGAVSWTRTSTALAWLTLMSSDDRVPLVSGEQIRMSCWARGDAVQVSAAVDLWDAAGDAGLLTGRITGTAATLDLVNWTYLEVVTTPAAGQIEASPVVVIQAGQAASTIQVTGFQIAPASAPTTWTMGGGAPIVLAGAKVSEVYVLDDRRQLDLTLLERRM